LRGKITAEAQRRGEEEAMHYFLLLTLRLARKKQPISGLRKFPLFGTISRREKRKENGNEYPISNKEFPMMK